MHAQDRVGPITVSLTLGVALALIAGVVLIFVPRIQSCPGCEGRGLLVEPPGHGVTIWAGSENLLVPFPCDCCGDRGKVSLLRRWRWNGSARPSPPIYLRGDGGIFRGKRQRRIEE